MSETPPEPDPGHTGHTGHSGHTGYTGPRVTAEQARDLGRLRRSTTDRHVAGVAGGLARHLDVDPAILRVAFVVLIFFGGAGLLLYGACWLLVPTDEGSDAPITLDDRTRAVALTAAGIIGALLLLGDALGDGSFFPWPLAILAVVALVVYSKRGSSGRGVPPPPGGPAPGASGAVGVPGLHDRSDPASPGTATEVSAESEAVYAAPPADYASYTYAAGYQPDYNPASYSPAPRPARKRGPLLFWFTMALAALGIGVLVVLAGAGVAVPPSAYPALVLAVCGVMLILGAFYGRGGGLILVGLLAAAATAATTAVEVADFTRQVHTPTAAADVPDAIDAGVGAEVVLDLTEVRDLDRLHGRTIEIDNGIGLLEVIVPDEGLDVSADLLVEGPGEFWLFDESVHGVGLRATGSHDGGDDVPELAIDARLGVGELRIHTESGDRPDARSEGANDTERQDAR